MDQTSLVPARDAIPAGMRVPILVNPAAGSVAQERLEQVLSALAAAGLEGEVLPTSPSELKARARELSEAGTIALAVAGGDGSVSSVADGMVGSSTILIALPLGTLNHFAGRYGLSTIEAVGHALKEGVVITIPVGIAGETTFVNNASCGF